MRTPHIAVIVALLAFPMAVAAAPLSGRWDVNALRVDDPHRFCFGALLNVLVAPHFTEFRMQPSLVRTLAARPQLLAMGIDEATALEIHGNIGSVLGRGRVTIFDGKDHDGAKALVLRSGARYDLGRKAPL
jgi:cyanophycinase-like exopeptidase